MGRKRGKRKAESCVALVPLSVYHDETACRLWIAWLERQLKKAYRLLAELVSKDQ